jgi:CMP-2-keto-3-deoxyoctulosonic acid synthetase
VAIIPARYASSRFPGKPLANIAGKPMIQRTYEQAKEATSLSDVYVATDDDRIKEVCEKVGAKVLMTSPDCPNGTARCAEAARQLQGQFDLVLNIQGDEPLLEPVVIDAVVATLQEAPRDVRICRFSPRARLYAAASSIQWASVSWATGPRGLESLLRDLTALDTPVHMHINSHLHPKHQHEH